MGYYTRFDIEIKTPMTKECAEQIVNRLNTIIGDKNCFKITGSDGGFEDAALATWNLEPYDDMKWYDWKEDVAQLAEEFPDVEFRLAGCPF